MEQISALLRDAAKVLVLGHVDPDGDSVGSTLALTLGLRQIGKRCYPACADSLPEEFGFLPGADGIAPRRPTGDKDLIVIVDSSDVLRIGGLFDERLFGQIPTLNLDHHVTNTRYADWNLVEETAATAEIVHDILQRLGVKIHQQIATCLLAGLVTDTRSFQTASTSARVLRMAAELVDRGAPLAEITDRLFSRKPLASIRLWTEALCRAVFRGRIMWTEITQEMLKATGETNHVAGELSNFLASAEEVDAAVVFRETGDSQFDCAFRSAPKTDVAQVALAFGGGGHPQAAGCLLIGSLDEVKDKVLGALEKSLEAQAEQSSQSTAAQSAERKEENVAP